MAPPPTEAWRVSLHGGHSGQFCDHGQGALRDILEAAIEAGYHTFGVTEHAPRIEPQYLFPEEIAMGWDVAKLLAIFDDYARTLDALAADFTPRLNVLRGFEIEVVPPDRYAEVMKGFRAQYGFDYIVGSVHWVDGIIIDYTQEQFDRAAEALGGLEALAVRYYETVAEMVEALRPEIVGHLDLVRKLCPTPEAVETPSIRAAAREALQVIRANGAILDLNTAALAKGLPTPYPAPWLIAMARDMGIPFCFGDDSHSPETVGQYLAEGRAYLIENGVTAIQTLDHSIIPLE